MSGGYSGALKNSVNRAQFLKWETKSIKKAARDLFKKMAVTDGDEIATIWGKLVSQDVIAPKPRLYFVKGEPFYVINSKEADAKVFLGICAEDGGFLEWRRRLGKFSCPLCRSTYDQEGRSEDSSNITLISPETRIVDGYVMVKLINKN